jgi:hypothetical protein
MLAAAAIGATALAAPANVGWAARSVSAHADASSVISGFISDKGSPVGRASVVVWAWPNQKSRGHLKAGSSFTLYPVGAALTSSTGAFRVDVDPRSLPQRVKNRHGIVNFELDAIDGSKTLSYRFSARGRAHQLGSTRWWRPLPAPGGSLKNATPTFRGDIGSRLAWISTDSPKTWVNESGKLVSTRDASEAERAAVGPTTRQYTAMAADLRASASQRDGSTLRGADFKSVFARKAPCHITWNSDILNKVEHFVNIETMPGIPETVTEEGGSTHTLGVGINVAGEGWTASGTASITRTSDSEVDVTDNNPHTETNLADFQNFTNQCAGRLEKDPWKFADMLTSDGHAIVATWYTASCGNHSTSTNWNSAGATAMTFAGGVDLGVVSVSAQSGYKNSENLHYHFNQDGEVCGNNVEGSLSSSAVEADTGSVG